LQGRKGLFLLTAIGIALDTLRGEILKGIGFDILSWIWQDQEKTIKEDVTMTIMTHLR